MANSDITPGQRFGRLIARSATAERRNGCVMWDCLCDCGKQLAVRAAGLRKKDNQSCGCLKMDLDIARFTTHNDSKSPTYETWKQLSQRCANPKATHWERYGGRGITVCARWSVYENFLADMGPRPKGMTLDRFPNRDGNYEPGNCRWATHGQQMNNQSRNRNLTAFGKTKTMTQWARDLGMRPATLEKRLRNKWPIEKALSQPVSKSHQRHYA